MLYLGISCRSQLLSEPDSLPKAFINRSVINSDFVIMSTIVSRWRWSRTYSTTRSVTSARDCTAPESLRRSSARMSCVCSTTASTVGRSSIRHRIGSFTSLSSRRALTDHGRFRFAGAEQWPGRAVRFFFNSRDMKFTRLIDEPHHFGFLYRNFWGNRRLWSQKWSNHPCYLCRYSRFS